MSTPESFCGPRQGNFATTHWSLVLRAGGESGVAGRAALEELCAGYWYPLYLWLRRSGQDAHTAADLVQGFFAGLLARDDLAQLSESGGRFRSFLLVALRRHVARERERADALKRGAGRAPLSLDAPAGEWFDAELAARRYALEPSDGETPERSYERGFARAVLDRSWSSLREDERAAGRAEAFARLESFLQEGVKVGGYEAAARDLGRTPGAIKLAVHRLRRRWRERLLADVARLVDRPQDVEPELKALLEALGPAPRDGRA